MTEHFYIYAQMHFCSLPWWVVSCWRGGVRAAGADGECGSLVSPGSVRLRRESVGCRTHPAACSSSAGRVCWEGRGTPAGFGDPGSARCGSERCCIVFMFISFHFSSVYFFSSYVYIVFLNFISVLVFNILIYCFKLNYNDMYCYRIMGILVYIRATDLH